MTPAYDYNGVLIYHGHAPEVLGQLDTESVHTCVTSIPYWGLRDYGTATWQGGSADCDHVKFSRGAKGNGGEKSTLNCVRPDYTPPVHEKDRCAVPFSDVCGKCGAIRTDNQIGLEKTPDEYVARIVAVFREVRRVLRSDGTLWLNIGDSYANDGKWGGATGGKHAEGLHGQSGIGRQKKQSGLKPKDLCMIPARVALALQADGWWVRSEIIWHKPNPMPASVEDRPTCAHEYIFLLTKSATYYYDHIAVKEPVAASQIGRVRDDAIGGASWEERGQHSAGGSYRKARDTFKRTGSKREQPIPGQLLGTHRPDRAESDWDTSTRNKRSVWTVPLAPCALAHFAVFPPNLIRPCILAGTSEAGCCPKCLAPYRRIVESVSAPVPKDYDGKHAKSDPQSAARRMLANQRGRREAGYGHDDSFPSGKTLGWEPSCTCGAGNPIPCTVLDPFIGSGTTALVAKEEGRNCVGIDLNLDYINNVAATRLAQGSLFSTSPEPVAAARPQSVKSGGTRPGSSVEKA